MTSSKENNICAPPPTADNYVQNGLYMQLDAVENTRSGHDATANMWEDLKGEFICKNLSGYVFEDNCLLCNPSSSGIPMTYSNAPSSPTTAEFVFSTSNGAIIWQQEAPPTAKLLAAYAGYLELGSNCTKAVPIAYGKLYSVSVVYSGSSSASDIIRCLLNGEDKTVARTDSWSGGRFAIGWRYGSGSYRLAGKLCSIRFYDRRLLQWEQLHNYEIDK